MTMSTTTAWLLRESIASQSRGGQWNIIVYCWLRPLGSPALTARTLLPLLGRGVAYVDSVAEFNHLIWVRVCMCVCGGRSRTGAGKRVHVEGGEE